MSVQTVFKEHFPLIAAIGAGLIAWGVHGADIAQLKKDVDQQKVETKADHDLIVELNTRSKYTADDVREIKEALKELAKK